MYVDYGHDYYETDEKEFLRSLSKVNGFQEADLVENRQGRISGRQKVRLVFTALAPFVGMVATLIGLIGLAIACWLLGPMIMSKFRLALALSKYLVLGIGALFFGVIAFLIKFLLASGRVVSLIGDLATGAAAHATGRVTTSKSENVEDGVDQLTNHKTESFSYVVKGDYYEVSEEAHELMLQRSGSTFRVYFTPRSKYLLALEPAVADSVKDPFKMEYREAS